MPAQHWVFPPADTADQHGIVGVGADLNAETVLEAYCSGLFPMPLETNGPIAWWSPDPRAILPLEQFHTSRSLRKSLRRFHFTTNANFEGVVRSCANPARPHGWIDDQMFDAYMRLHQLGWAHSVEVLNEYDELVGGVYGIGIGGFFAGESMFHTVTDASKAALHALVSSLEAAGVELFDVQWLTPHLESLGAQEIARSDYLDRLARALDRPGHNWRIHLE